MVQGCRQTDRGCCCCPLWRGQTSCVGREQESASQLVTETLRCTTHRQHMLLTSTHTHTHTHPFNGPLSRTTQVSRYQKGKNNMDFTEARDSEWQWHQLGHMQVCTSLQTHNHVSTPPLSFLQAGCPSCCPTDSVKALKALCYWQAVQHKQHHYYNSTWHTSRFAQLFHLSDNFDQTWINQSVSQPVSQSKHGAVTYSAVDTKSLSSPPDSSSCSRVRDSPVDCSPITTHCNPQYTILDKNTGLTASLSRTTWVNRHQKGKRFWDGSDISWTACNLHLASAASHVNITHTCV